MVETLGGEMDTQGSLKDQLEIAIQRRDVAAVKRILNLSSQARANAGHHKTPPNRQILMKMAKLMVKDKGEGV